MSDTQTVQVLEMKFETEEHIANWYVQVGEGLSARYLHDDGSLQPQATKTKSSTGWYEGKAQAKTAIMLARIKGIINQDAQ